MRFIYKLPMSHWLIVKRTCGSLVLVYSIFRGIPQNQMKEKKKKKKKPYQLNVGTRMFISKKKRSHLCDSFQIVSILRP